MASLQKRGRVWYYRFVDADGRRVMRRGCPDRRVTEQMAHAAETEAAKVRNGLVDPKEVAYRDHEARPLAEHLAAYSAHLADKGRTTAHVVLSVGRARRIIALFRGSPPGGDRAGEFRRRGAGQSEQGVGGMDRPSPVVSSHRRVRPEGPEWTQGGRPIAGDVQPSRDGDLRLREVVL
jgi:hypothetical protein